jgi:hypothetical protein
MNLGPPTPGTAALAHLIHTLQPGLDTKGALQDIALWKANAHKTKTVRFLAPHQIGLTHGLCAEALLSLRLCGPQRLLLGHVLAGHLKGARGVGAMSRDTPEPTSSPPPHRQRVSWPSTTQSPFIHPTDLVEGVWKRNGRNSSSVYAKHLTQATRHMSTSRPTGRSCHGSGCTTPRNAPSCLEITVQDGFHGSTTVQSAQGPLEYSGIHLEGEHEKGLWRLSVHLFGEGQTRGTVCERAKSSRGAAHRVSLDVCLPSTNPTAVRNSAPPGTGATLPSNTLFPFRIRRYFASPG